MLCGGKNARKVRCRRQVVDPGWMPVYAPMLDSGPISRGDARDERTAIAVSRGDAETNGENCDGFISRGGGGGRGGTTNDLRLWGERSRDRETRDARGRGVQAKAARVMVNWGLLSGPA